MSGINVEDILTNVQDLVNASVGAQVRLANTNDFAKQATEANAGMQTAIGADDKIIQDAKSASELSGQARRLKAGGIFGTNLDSSGEVLTALSSRADTAFKVKQEALRTLQEKDSVGIFDDPISWVMNQITREQDVSNYNNASRAEADYENRIASLNQLTQSTVATQNLMDSSMTQAVASAASDKVVQTAAINANNEHLKTATLDRQGVMDALTMSNDRLQAMQAGFSATMQAKNLAISQAHLALDQQRFQWQKDEKAIADEAKKKDKATDAYLLDLTNDGLKRMGLDTVAPDGVRANTILSLIKSNSPAGQVYRDALDISMNSTKVGGSTILASSPSRAADLLFDRPVPIKTDPSQAPIVNLIDQARQVAAQAKDATGQPIKYKSKEDFNQSVNKAAEVILRQQAANVTTGGDQNIFAIPSVGALITQSKPLQELPVIQKIVAPMIANGVDLDDPNKLFAAITNGVKDGKISVNEAAQIAQLYQRGTQANLSIKQPLSFGLSITPQKKNDVGMFDYNYPMKGPRVPGAMFNNSQVVNMTDPQAVMRLLNKQLAGEMLIKTGADSQNYSPI